MITNKVYRLLKEANLPHGLVFAAAQEIEIVMDMVYINGYPLPPEFQALVYNWIQDNPKLFLDDTRNF